MICACGASIHDLRLRPFCTRIPGETSDVTLDLKSLKEEDKSMLNSRMKKLALGLSTPLVMIYSPAHAAATINVAVAASFAKTANDIVGAFQSYYFTTYGLSYSVALTVDTAQQIEADIIAGGTTGPYDLFLSSSKNEPNDLAKNYPSLVTGASFNYARDVLELYSISVNISGGLPYPLTTNFVIADPTQDNYGAAAAQILASQPWSIPTSSIPGGFVVTRSDVGTSYSAVKKGNFAHGFVAKSQICQYANGVYTYPALSYHHEYKPNDDAHPYATQHLTGIEISLAGTTDQATELANFVSFLTGAADSNGVANSNWNGPHSGLLL
jgi:molybdate transport system substrate-binding protein